MDRIVTMYDCPDETFHIQKSMFRALTPQQSLEVKSYAEALDYAFSRDDVRNIAISGSYGSGKSSVFNSYANQHKEKRLLCISLAHYDEQEMSTIMSKNGEDVAEKTEDTKKNNQRIVNVLEGKILNQLLHQIPPEKIPQSNFRIKREVSVPKRIGMIAGVLFFVLLLYYVFSFGSWCTFCETLADSWLASLLLLTANPYARLGALFICVVLLGVGIYFVSRTHNFQNVLKKLI